ncbi:hypothetical protein A6R68_10273 [Neotoma lepida]|uniref:Uncharacterized protein n=1 Tax=Neotoma lepida TaxID=56216 RepID=A0A1A6FXG6_NEOLE|nr:hypothetical protein A6R68_10273 [Neotoma lepida]
MGGGIPGTPLTSRPHDLCNDVSSSSKKPKNHKKPSNPTKSTPSGTTVSEAAATSRGLHRYAWAEQQ